MRIRISMPEDPALRFQSGPLVPSTLDDASGLDALLRLELGEHGVDPGVRVQRRTELGWPFTTLTGRITAGARVVEERIAVMYGFAEWRGLALVRCGDLARWPALAPIVLAALAAATPDWRGDGEVACLAHLYE